MYKLITTIMKNPSISTIIIIICLLIIGLYAMGEVNYFASKVAAEKNYTSPVIVIPNIGIEEKINNHSLNQGVLSEPAGNVPIQNSIILYGHRTLQGSPFLRLNDVSMGDSLVLEWPGVGEVKYTVINKKVVPANYQLQPSGNNIYLITCDPIGSTENRLILEGQFQGQGPINEAILQNNPQETNALMITALFLIVRLIFSFFYPKDNRIYILATVLIISAILFYCCINPFPSELIYEKILFLNGGM